MRMPGSGRWMTAIPLLLVWSVASFGAANTVRLSGALDGQIYGYQDIYGEDHLWLIPSLDLSLGHAGSPVTFHFSADWLGDNADEFKGSSQSRLLKAYAQYGNPYGSSNIRGGRFFLARGVAVGVLDGVEAQTPLAGGLSAAVFAGMNGPEDRRWRRESLDRAFMGGGELRWTSAAIPYLKRAVFTASFATQQRRQLKERHRVGASVNARLHQGWSVMGWTEFRAENMELRRASGRLRYSDEMQIASVEAGLFQPDFADYSWFKDFEYPSYTRYRALYQRFLHGRWGAGVDATFLSSEQSGFRAGPTVLTPYGEAGYRLSGGNHSESGGPWVNLRYTLRKGLTAHADWSLTSYEWEAFDIAAGDLMTTRVGVKLTPAIASSLTFSAEFQMYQTPEVDSDRRFLGGLRWRFDREMGR